MKGSCELCASHSPPLMVLQTKNSLLQTHQDCTLFFPWVRLQEQKALCPVLPSDSYVSDCSVCLNRAGVQGLLLKCQACPMYIHRNCLSAPGLLFNIADHKIRVNCQNCAIHSEGVTFQELEGQRESKQEQEQEQETLMADIHIDIHQLAEINLYLDQDSLLKQQEEQQKQAEHEQQKRKETQFKRLQLDRQDRYIKETLINQISSKRKLTGKRLRLQHQEPEINAILKIDSAYWT